jgi:CubicO group peptidase (beta-lactamase class C family)
MRTYNIAGNLPLRTLQLSFLALVVLLLCGTAFAQDNRDIAGDYSGEIGSKQATLHLRIRPDGALTATLDNIDPRAPWMFTCSDLHRNGQTLAFTVPSILASWSGTFSSGKDTLSGTWTQKGSSWFISFTRQKFIPATKPSALDGIWLGTQSIGGDTASRIQIVFRSDVAGREYCTVDALDIYDMDLECTNIVFNATEVSFDIPVVGTRWNGSLQADGVTLTGNLLATVIEGGVTREVNSPLNLKRQTSLATEKPRPGPTYDPPLSPVGAADLEAVLARDLAGALKNGELAPSTGAGVSIGVYTHGTTRIFSFGTAKPDSIFEIGSITKTFTGLLLAQMAEQREVQLDQPVRELLPAGAAAKPEGPEITLLDLATHRSGLPAMPDNISIANLDQPYADYHVADLLSYVGKHGVANPSHAASNFGSLGFGLLGTALANRAGTSFAQLLEDEITGPLQMSDTFVTASPEQLARFVPGHDQFHGPATQWNSDALAGAIALRSTAQDMLTYLVANLHPEQIKPKEDSPSAATLPTAIRQSLEPRAGLSPGMQIALGWLYQTETGNYWHNGATAAYSSYAFFNPKGDYAAVVLLNTSPGVDGSFVENLGRHVYQRLAGKPALSLNP